MSAPFAQKPQAQAEDPASPNEYPPTQTQTPPLNDGAPPDPISPQTTGFTNLQDHTVSPQLTGANANGSSDAIKSTLELPSIGAQGGSPLAPGAAEKQVVDAAYPGIEVVSPPYTEYHDPGLGQQKTEHVQPPPIQNGVGGRNYYAVAMPLRALQQGPGPVDCPICNVREVTRVEYMTGNYTHIASLILCCCVCLGCIPYMMSSMKDVEHHCGSCNSILAIWHRSGNTEVVAHGHPT